jgi:hypothetical protein
MNYYGHKIELVWESYSLNNKGKFLALDYFQKACLLAQKFIWGTREVYGKLMIHIIHSMEPYLGSGYVKMSWERKKTLVAYRDKLGKIAKTSLTRNFHLKDQI